MQSDRFRADVEKSLKTVFEDCILKKTLECMSTCPHSMEEMANVDSLSDILESLSAGVAIETNEMRMLLKEEGDDAKEKLLKTLNQSVALSAKVICMIQCHLITVGMFAKLIEADAIGVDP